jgi:hypothetical protein
MFDYTPAPHAQDQSWSQPQHYQPDAEPITPPAPPAPQPPRSRSRLFIALGLTAAVVVGGATAAIVAGTTGGGASMLTVNGTLELTDIGGDGVVSTGGHGCTGSGGYSDITAGAEVVISDDQGRTLTITHLTGGTGLAGVCEFDFTTSLPKGKHYYGIEVTHRGTVKFSEKEIAAPALSLGS